MRKVSRSALVPFSARQMFSLVDDVESYPSFLPWCKHAEEHWRNDRSVEASIELQKGALSRRFTTRNSLNSPDSIDIALVAGPFRHLAGGWRFQDLGDAGSKVSLNLEFEFKSRMLDAALGPFFEEICSSLVDAFTRRAACEYREE